jgi:hypothetical protein
LESSGAREFSLGEKSVDARTFIEAYWRGVSGVTWAQEVSMKSSDLSSYGFGVWLPFSKVGKPQLIAALPSRPGVYAIRWCREFVRKKGTSDILYFGKGTNQQGIKHRIRQYFSPGHLQRTNLRLLALAGDSCEYELAFVETTTGSGAVALEATLLEKYEQDHGELPPENKRR